MSAPILGNAGLRDSAPPLDARQVVAFQDACIGFGKWPEKAGPARPPGAPWPWIENNHVSNALLWREEDLARRRKVDDSEIAANKRAIDRFNQQRNDAVERCDEILTKELEDKMGSASPLHSETPGMMIDRLSILSLKVHAMREQASRSDVDEKHRKDCGARLKQLIEQRGDLAVCLDALLADCRTGRARFKLYSQFKMYNDPTLNPSVYGER
jgi:Protein of unknown function (DUF4254)